jgi:hypothetical protein
MHGVSYSQKIALTIAEFRCRSSICPLPSNNLIYFCDVVDLTFDLMRVNARILVFISLVVKSAAGLSIIHVAVWQESN